MYYRTEGEFLVFLFPLLTYRKKKSNVGFIVKKSRWCWCADEGSWWWWQKIQAFPRGERCYTQEQKKKGKIPVDDENKWPFLSCNSFSLSFIYTHIVVSVLHITLYLAPLKSSFFDLRSSKRSEGSRKSFKTKKSWNVVEGIRPKSVQKLLLYSALPLVYGSHKKHFVTVIIINRFRAICVPLCSMERASLTTILRFIVHTSFHTFFPTALNIAGELLRGEDVSKLSASNYFGWYLKSDAFSNEFCLR